MCQLRCNCGLIALTDSGPEPEPLWSRQTHGFLHVRITTFSECLVGALWRSPTFGFAVLDVVSECPRHHCTGRIEQLHRVSAKIQAHRQQHSTPQGERSLLDVVVLDRVSKAEMERRDAGGNWKEGNGETIRNWAATWLPDRHEPISGLGWKNMCSPHLQLCPSKVIRAPSLASLPSVLTRRSVENRKTSGRTGREPKQPLQNERTRSVHMHDHAAQDRT